MYRKPYRTVNVNAMALYSITAAFAVERFECDALLE